MPDQEQFPKNSDFWLGEIRGNIARLNDAAAAVETDLIIPKRTKDVATIGESFERIKAFQFEFRRLYKNSKQILNADIKEKVKYWFEVSGSSKTSTDIKTLELGLALSNELQDALYTLGVKDIGVEDPELFPYKYYEAAIDGDAGNGNQ